MVYFIGNILDTHQEADQHPERGSRHFHITPQEAASIDATGLPVHLEHAGNVKVGTVTRSWDDASGCKWVLGHVDTSSIEGKYVRNDLSSATPLYTGLSLQHIHREYDNGSASKEGLEVSICKEPRRPGCRIVHASASSASKWYKVPCHSMRQHAMSETETTTPPTNPEPTPAAAEAPAEQKTPDTTTLMKEVVDQSRINEELAKTNKDLADKLAEFTNREAKAREEQLEQQTQMATKLGDAVLEHVAKLDPTLANEDTTKAISTLRAQYPQEVARVMEVACCASKHAQKLEAELARSKEDAERKLMEQAYHAAAANKPGVHGVSAAVSAPAVEVSVPASKRARVDNPFAVHRSTPQAAAASSAPHASMDTLEQIREAYNGLKGSGSTTDAMKSVAGIISQQRERGFR